MDVLKIISIPHISILTDDVSAASQAQTIASYAQNMAVMLTEIYQQYKELYVRTGKNPDMAIDVTWITEPVENQPYKANINIYIIFRAINDNPSAAEQVINNMKALITSTLDADKYEYEGFSIESYFSYLSKLGKGTIQAIVKDERMEDLQNQYFPACYAYDIFPIIAVR